MVNDFWDEELTEEETESALRKVADQVIKRRLEVPAVMTLQMSKPVAPFMANWGIVLAPFLVPLLGFNAVNDYTRVLTKRENVERLMQMIEESTQKTPIAEAASSEARES